MTTDTDECGTTCDACENRIEAGEPVHTHTYPASIGGRPVMRVCDYCDTNGFTSSRAKSVTTATHRCGCGCVARVA